MTARLLLLAALMAGTALAAGAATRTEAVPVREPLETFPLVVDGWRGREHPALSGDLAAEAGVDDALERSYRTGEAAVALYIGYYETQRQGDSVHSPLNCLPGTGWVPMESGYLTLPLRRSAGAAVEPITLRRLRVRRGADEALVFYWYQSRGRVIASEYRSKAYLMYDAVRLNRTDTALVRVFSMVDDRAGGAARAQADLVSFVGSVFPVLGRYLPE